MGKKYLRVVIICLVIFSIINLINTVIRNGGFSDSSYYLSAFFNISLGIVLIVSFVYLYKKYEK